MSRLPQMKLRRGSMASPTLVPLVLAMESHQKLAGITRLGTQWTPPQTPALRPQTEGVLRMKSTQHSASKYISSYPVLQVWFWPRE